MSREERIEPNAFDQAHAALSVAELRRLREDAARAYQVPLWCVPWHEKGDRIAMALREQRPAPWEALEALAMALVGVVSHPAPAPDSKTAARIMEILDGYSWQEVLSLHAFLLHLVAQNLAAQAGVSEDGTPQRQEG